MGLGGVERDDITTAQEWSQVHLSGEAAGYLNGSVDSVEVSESDLEIRKLALNSGERAVFSKNIFTKGSVLRDCLVSIKKRGKSFSAVSKVVMVLSERIKMGFLT